MRVRCSSCGAEYEAAVTRAALVLVDRCDRCGRTCLAPADRDRSGVPRPAAAAPDRDAPSQPPAID